MQSFSLDELHRLVQLLPVTDPTTAEYHMLLRSIECLDSIGQTLDEIEERVFQREHNAEPSKVIRLGHESGVTVAPFTAPEFPETPEEAEAHEAAALVEKIVEAAPKPEPPAKTYEAAEVRAALVEARSKGVDVKALLAKVGADNFTAIPAAKYAELMALLQEVVG